MNRSKLTIIFTISGFIGLAVFFYFSALNNYVVGNNLQTIQPIDLNQVIIDQNKKEIVLQTSDKLSLLFTGDIMLDRSVWLKTKEAGDYKHPFKNLDYFADYDLRIGNLEGGITNFKSISNGTGGSRFFFTFSPLFLESLQQYFDAFDLANNHTLNFGSEGLKQTRTFLDEYGISYFGDPDNNVEKLSVIIERNNIKIGLVGYHDLATGGFDNTLLEVGRLRTLVDYIVVIPHWGTEYITDKINNSVKNKAHQLIDAGADVIIGTHPHVIQPIEEYNGKLIFYSLGNFIFDQYFSIETQQGLNIAIYLEKGDNMSVEYKILPIQINSESQPALASEEMSSKILDSLSTLSEVSTSTRESLFN